MAMANHSGPDVPVSFVVHDERRPGPATHVLVIGAGTYPYLFPSEEDAKEGEPGYLVTLAKQQLAQITAPPISAIRFASWAAGKLNNPTKPLGSVALVASATAPVLFEHPRTKVRTTVPPATLEETRTAFEYWLARGNEDPNNLVIFFFCGHGIAEGLEHSLLLSDFGKNVLNPFEHAIDLRRFYLGMDQCRAAEQCFFIDACRSPAGVAERSELGGDPLIAPTKPYRNIRAAPTISSTDLGHTAHAPPGADEPTYFTKALLKGLGGMGAESSRGDWRVNTESLLGAIGDRLRRVEAAGLRQRSNGSDLQRVDLHFLDRPPLASVVVQCTPERALTLAALRCSRKTFLEQSGPPASKRWELELELGEYEFRADFPAGAPFEGSTRNEVIGSPRETVVPLRLDERIA